MTLEVVVDAQGGMDVRHHLPLAWVGRALPDLCLAFDDTIQFDQGDDGYARFVRNVGPEGQLTPFAPCIALGDADLDTHYRVLPEHAQASPTHGIEDAPHATQRGFFSIGRAFIPAVRFSSTHAVDMPVDVHFVLPEGWTLVASHELDDSTLHASSPREAQDVVFEFGRLAQLEANEGAVRVRVASGDFTERELLPLQTLAQRTLSLGRELLGPLGAANVLVTYDRAARGVGGGRIGDAVSLTSDRPPDGTALSPAGRVLVHELMHLWNTASDAYWLHEGMTRYLEWIMRARLDALSEEDALAELMRIYGRYRRDVGVRSVGEAAPSMGGWPYEAGAVLAFCADTELRHRDRDLFSVLRQTREHVGLGQPLDRASFMSSLRDASPAVALDVEGWLTHRGGLPFGYCLSRAGYRLRGVAYRDITREGEQAVLRAGRNLEWPPTIGRPRASSGFEASDRLITVNGERVASLAELGWALRGASLGDRLRFRVRRHGRVRVVVQRSPDLDAFAARALRYVAVMDPQASRAASPLHSDVRAGAAHSAP